jgi:hypothetical protein
MLIFRVNLRWGIADLAFAPGDDVIADFIMAMQFLPMVINKSIYIYVCDAQSRVFMYTARMLVMCLLCDS